MYNNIQKYYPRFLFFAKLIILVFAYRLVSQRIFEEGSYVFFLGQMDSLKTWAPWVILFLLAMTGLNWYVEVLKWQRLAGLIQPTSFSEALKQSLSSLTVSLITPNRIGEYGAKALYFSREFRPRVILLNFISNFSQMGTTVLFGSLGLWWISGSLTGLGLEAIDWLKAGLLALTAGIGLVLISKMWKGFYSKLVRDFKSVPVKTLINVFALSLLKYLVFSHQFYFLVIFSVHFPPYALAPCCCYLFFPSSTYTFLLFVFVLIIVVVSFPCWFLFFLVLLSEFSSSMLFLVSFILLLLLLKSFVSA